MMATRTQKFERWYALVDDPSPIVKQFPTALGVAVATVITLAMPDLGFDDTGTGLSGLGVITLATVLAVAITRSKTPVPQWEVLAVPMIDILGLGLFRAGTGGTSSLFTVLIMLPVVWLAAAPGLRWVFIASGLSAVALLMPYIVDTPTSSSQWLRIIIAPVTYAVIAGVVNELARQGRVRAEEAERLARERAHALAENEGIVARIRESETRYRELLELFRSVWNATTAQAVIGTGPTGGIVAWNPGAAALLGPEDIDTEYAARIEEFFPVEVLEALDDEAEPSYVGDPLPNGLRALFREADTGSTAVRELNMLRSDGSTVPVRLSVNPRLDGSGNQVGYLLMATDETRAIEVAKMKDEFVGMISHELRTPLSSILGYIELLRDDPHHPLTDEQLHFLTIAERNAQRLLKLVGDLLFTAQVESGSFPIEARDIDLVSVVHGSLDTATPLAEAAGVTLVPDLPRDACPVRADALRIGQAIDNLVANAIKFTPRGGKVTIGIALLVEEVAVSIRDTGLGIPQDELDRLFTRFFRASTATRNAVPGVGLGLNITKAIVTAHGGWLDVVSEEGVGTEFRMVLPRR